jgi:hypothetical protein
MVISFGPVYSEEHIVATAPNAVVLKIGKNTNKTNANPTNTIARN